MARLAVRQGHEVMLSNSTDPSTLPTTMLTCQIGTNAEAAAFGEVVVIAVPFVIHTDIAPDALAGKIVIDATNFDPEHDGVIAELDTGTTTSSELLAAHFKGASVVKALNAIEEPDLERDCRPPGTPHRRALPIAGDDEKAKVVVCEVLDQFGFDVIDTGPLAEGWRFAPGQPAWQVPLIGSGLQEALAEAVRPGSQAQRTLDSQAV
jgi:8-hydroxy-5-deazaflavin:NADPH oxidoreductase